MHQTFTSLQSLSRIKGTLCFSPNFTAVIFVRDTESASRAVNWNALTVIETFAAFKSRFDVRPTRIDNAFYLDADAREVSSWIGQRDTYNSFHPYEKAGLGVSASQEALSAQMMIDLSTVLHFPEAWRHSPIEVFVKALNEGSTGRANSDKLCVIACEFNSLNLDAAKSVIEIIEVTRTCFRDAAMKAVQGTLSSRGIKHAILLGHAGCGNAKGLREASEIFEALVSEGWSTQAAQEYLEPRFPISDDVDLLRRDYDVLKRLYKSVQIAPMFFNHYTKMLQLPGWYSSHEL